MGAWGRRISWALAGAVLMAGIAPAAALAGDYRSAQDVTLPAGETVRDDLYAAGGTVTINGTVERDANITGGTVRITGRVGGSVNVAGGTVEIAGTVAGAVRVAGGTVTVSGSVGRDLAAAGGTVIVDSTARIQGDVVGGMGSLRIDGSVGGNLRIGGGEVTVNGQIGGGIDSQIDRLIIGPQARITGDVRYTSDRDAQIAPGAQIGGATERRQPTRTRSVPLLPDNPLLSLIGYLVGLLLLGYALLLARPGPMLATAHTLASRPLISLGAGLAAWIGQFLLLIALGVLAALLGNLAGALGGAMALPLIVVLLLIVLFIFVSQVYLAMALGSLFGRWGVHSAWLGYLLGAVAWAVLITLCGLLSGALAAVVYLAGWILGLGAWVMQQFERRRRDELSSAGAVSPPTPAAAVAASPPPRAAEPPVPPTPPAGSPPADGAS